MTEMKILAISGSPKRGNTYSVLNMIKENYPNIDFKILMLNEVNLKQCKGCYTCISKGEQYCPLKDDRDMIIDEILEADGVIFASPVYVNNVTSLMKNFMERFGFEAHRPRYYDKYAMLIAVCAMFGAKETNEFMKAIFGTFGFNIVSSLELEIAVNTEKEKKYVNEKTMKEFNKFITSIKNQQKNTPTMGDLVRFNIFKSISKLNKEYFEADYKYYKDNPKFPLEASPADRKLAKQKASNMINEFMKVGFP